jgi:hypothetical protein
MPTVEFMGKQSAMWSPGWFHHRCAHSRLTRE